jgi:hypothetical protein
MPSTDQLGQEQTPEEWNSIASIFAAPNPMIADNATRLADIGRNVGAFARGGVHGVLSEHGVAMPGWMNNAAGVLRNDDLIAALGMATGGKSFARWTPQEEAALARWSKDITMNIPDEIAGRAETALMQRAREKGLIERRERYKRQPGDAKPKEAPAQAKPDFLDLAHEPRQAVLLIQTAADQGNLTARAILNQLIQTAPTKRDALIQSYIDKLTKAGWKAPARDETLGDILSTAPTNPRLMPPDK